MVSTTKKRTARMTPVTPVAKRRAVIEKRPPATTLITGGTGFLGSHLVRQLVAAGPSVTWLPPEDTPEPERIFEALGALRQEAVQVK